MKKRTFKTEMKLNLAEPKLNKNNTQGYSYARYCLFD